jgi:hypothetical protein
LTILVGGKKSRDAIHLGRKGVHSQLSREVYGGLWLVMPRAGYCVRRNHKADVDFPPVIRGSDAFGSWRNRKRLIAWNAPDFRLLSFILTVPNLPQHKPARVLSLSDRSRAQRARHWHTAARMTVADERQCPSITRRSALSAVLGVVSAVVSASVFESQSKVGARTILDEELERAGRNRHEREAERVSALLRGFDAVEKASAQLDDLEGILKADSADWRFARAFARRFNNDVAREGMLPIAKGLVNSDDRIRGAALCNSLEDALVEVSRAAGGKNREASLAALAKAREIIHEYLGLRPPQGSV